MVKPKSFINKYYIKNTYYLNYKILLKKFPQLFSNTNTLLVKSKKFNLVVTQQNKKTLNLKKLFTQKIYRFLKLKSILNKNLNFKNFSHKMFRFLIKPPISNEFKFLPDSLPFLKSLKTVKTQNFKMDNLINYYGYIYLKSSGINTFATLTNSKGEVISAYSAGIFKDVKRIKEKRSIHIVRQLGQLISYNTYKCNFNYIFLNIRLDSLKIRSIIKNFKEGFFLMFKLNIFKIIFKRPVIRNGVKLKKLPRK